MLQTQPTTCFTASQLEQLCQSSRIERTMYLLFALNHWAKARNRLFYVDRQGLYIIKGVVLRQAYISGALEVRCYIDGRDGFGAELAYDTAADCAAEGFLWHIEALVGQPPSPAEDIYDRLVRQFYTRMTGKASIFPADVQELEIQQIRTCIFAQLQMLERKARSERQPIPYKELQALCIAPSDLLYIQDRRHYDLGSWDSWQQLDSSDLRKLDPEGLSLIAFHYTSPVAHFVFHLPLRLAEEFVPLPLIEQLKRKPAGSREFGEHYGRAITEAESLQHPIADLLGELGVETMTLFPRLLKNKQAYLHIQPMHHLARTDGTEEGANELAPLLWHRAESSTEKSPSHPICALGELDTCLLCSVQIHTDDVLARLEHWQIAHPGQDLTIGQARWILNCRTPREQFYQEYPPDYRAHHRRGWGTRYWRIETLAAHLKHKVAQNSGAVLPHPN